MSPEIEASLRLCPRLPTLPGVALRIVDVASDPDVDLTAVTGLLSRDPALAAKILRVANSSLYKQFREVQTLRQAVAVLGLNATITMTLSFSLAACLRDTRAPGLDLDYFWRRALLSALVARILGEQCRLHSLDEAFLAALLQDIGMLALDAALPARYAPAIDACTDHDALPDREREALGIDHREAGAWLMQHWGLPDYLAKANRASHDFDRRDMPADMISFLGCIAVSGRVADLYLTDSVDAATVTARHVAQSCLNLSAEELAAVLQQLREALPEVEALFETPILSAPQAMGLTERAREILASRNLQLLQAAVAERSREAEFQQLADRLYEVARRDTLTGVFNRRHFDTALNDAFTQAGGQRQPLALAYLDLDDFKLINDRYGHVTGDTILTAVARHMQARLRPGDLLARYGGEEFVMLMPGLNSTEALPVIERVRAEVEALAHPLNTGELHHVTLSAGIAAYGAGEPGWAAPIELMHAADQALYAAKRQGRNRVIVADETTARDIKQARRP